MLHKAACHPHKSENSVHAYWRYHLVEWCTMSIKEGQVPTLPNCRTRRSEVNLLVFKNWVRSHKYDQNHSNAVPPIPNRLERSQSKIQWSTVSNAAERSRSSKIIDLFWSKAIAISLWTRISLSIVKFPVRWLVIANQLRDRQTTRTIL